MSKNTRTLIYLVIFALLLAGAAFVYRQLSARVAPGEAAAADADRTKAPDFTVQDADGNAVKLSDFLGKPVVLNFWASWCPPCKSEMPEFDAVFGEMGGDVVFMMVDLADGQRETVESGAAYVEGQGFTFPVYFDTALAAANAYSVSGIPTTVFIDKEGYVVYTATGAISGDTLKEKIGLIE